MDNQELLSNEEIERALAKLSINSDYKILEKFLNHQIKIKLGSIISSRNIGREQILAAEIRGVKSVIDTVSSFKQSYQDKKNNK